MLLLHTEAILFISDVELDCWVNVSLIPIVGAK